MTGAAWLGAIGTAHAGNDDVYDLGQIHVTAPGDAQQQEFDSFGASTISREQTSRYNVDTLEKAVDLSPGVSFNNSGGSRNEANVYIHGFDRWSIPLSVDGVRIYLPFDNRLDFARFLTQDLSQVQIAKGYVSVLDGPGGLGGAINLVTRKPTKPFEGEWRAQASFGNDGSYDGTKLYARAGGKLENFYFQGSGTWQNIKGWELPHGFQPTTLEDGGRRDFSASRDWSINLKAGWTPNAEDEYSINYIRNEGRKNAPYNIYPDVPSPRYWEWPYWNVQILSASSQTAIGESSGIKTRFFWETFDNAINMWDDPRQTLQYTSNAALSVYNDWAIGGVIEGTHDFGDRDTLKLAAHFRRDSHTSWSRIFTDQYGTNQSTSIKSDTCQTSMTNPNIFCFTTPDSTFVEDTYSIAAENTFHATDRLDLVLGASYDWRHLDKAEDYVSGGWVNVPPQTRYEPYYIDHSLANASAFNWQAAAIWQYTDTSKLFAGISDRTRFPTLFERFSTRFGSAVSNPDLAPERAINYQLGWASSFASGSQVSVLAYYSDVRDMIQSVNVSGTYTDPLGRPGIAYSGTQNQNVGSGYRYGIDFAFDYEWSPELTIGGNISYIHNKIRNPSDPTFLPTGVPTVKGMAYVSWKPIDGLTLTPNVQFANDRWSQSTTYRVGSTTYNNYVATGSYVLANFDMEYAINPNLKLSAGVKNIFDSSYELTWGFPERGRNFYLAMGGTF